MRFTKKVPYKLKSLVPMLGLAGATMFVGCNPQHEPDEPQVHHDVELYFNNCNIKSLELDTIRKYARNQYVDSIYMIPDDEYGIGGGFSAISRSEYLTQLRVFLEERINISPKVRGRGDLLFDKGLVNPADSLWFVQQGWTVNEWRRRQR